MLTDDRTALEPLATFAKLLYALLEIQGLADIRAIGSAHIGIASQYFVASRAVSEARHNGGPHGTRNR
jgi:hypothetical protein